LSVAFESRFAWLLRALLSPNREQHPSQTPLASQRAVPALWTKNASGFASVVPGSLATEGIDHGGFPMTLGTSLFLIAVGAVLRFAVNVSTSGFNIHTVGVILMIVGAVGFIISLLWMTMWADRRNRVARERVVYDDRDYPPARGV
jgi:hypothetical protein